MKRMFWCSGGYGVRVYGTHNHLLGALVESFFLSMCAVVHISNYNFLSVYFIFRQPLLFRIDNNKKC